MKRRDALQLIIAYGVAPLFCSIASAKNGFDPTCNWQNKRWPSLRSALRCLFGSQSIAENNLIVIEPTRVGEYSEPIKVHVPLEAGHRLTVIVDNKTFKTAYVLAQFKTYAPIPFVTIKHYPYFAGGRRQYSTSSADLEVCVVWEHGQKISYKTVTQFARIYYDEV